MVATSSLPVFMCPFGEVLRFPPHVILTSPMTRGARVSIVLTVIRITPWRLQRKILICMMAILLTSLLCYANPLSLGIAAFFVLQFIMLIVQAYWVCELTYTGWKQIPGSICVLPEVVPITQVVSKSPLPSYFCSFVHRLDSQPRSFRIPS